MGDDEVLATSDGLIQCLRMLAEEASILRLHQTWAPLLGARYTAPLAVAATGTNQPAEALRPSTVLH